jgi:hypothetical protein
MYPQPVPRTGEGGSEHRSRESAVHLLPLPLPPLVDRRQRGVDHRGEPRTSHRAAYDRPDFFLAASGVNATILVAISVTISSIVRQRSEKQILGRSALFVAQLCVVFIGMVASGLGILVFNPSVPLDSLTFRVLAGLVLVTWIIGFMLLVIGVEVSVFPDLGRR